MVMVFVVCVVLQASEEVFVFVMGKQRNQSKMHEEWLQKINLIHDN